MYDSRNVAQYRHYEYEGSKTLTRRVDEINGYYTVDQPFGFVQRADAEIECEVVIENVDTIDMAEDVNITSNREELEEQLRSVAHHTALEDALFKRVDTKVH